MRFASAGHRSAQLNRSLPVLFASALLSALAAASLTGCGLGKIDTSTPQVAQVIPAFKGTMMGGTTPVVNATVKIYTTGSAVNCGAGATGACVATDAGYGNGTFLQEANSQTGTPHQDTDGTGSFAFAGGYRCPAGEFAYIVGSGGSPGISTAAANSKIMLVAALGRCEDLYSTVTGSGGNYSSAPTVVITNAAGDTTGSGATATAVMTGTSPNESVASINVTNAGSGYTAAPTIGFTGGGGSGTYAVATLGSGATAGQVTGINLVGGYSGYSGSPIIINEITTVAAGYALGNFAYDNGTGTVLIGAPPTNNAAQVSGTSTGCVAGVGSCTVTAAAGLYHAFLNAANLANVFSTSTLTTANTAPPGNANAVVPTAMINTIANILANCVDTAGTGGQCSGLPGGADTFAAVLSLASNPTLGGSGTAVTTLLSLPTGQAQFSPIVTTARDFSIAINYPTVTANGLAYDFSGALDINDVYYVGNAAGNGTAPANVVSFASNGNLLGVSATNPNFKYTYSMAMDALGNGYFGNGSGSGNNALGVFTTSAGVPSSITPVSIVTSAQGSQGTGLLKIYAVAADLANNVWVTGATNSGTAPASTTYTYKCPASVTTATICAGEAGGNNTVSSSGGGLAVDPNQNIWIGTNNTLNVLENTNTVGSPSYGSSITSNNTVTTTATNGGGPILGIAFAGTPYVGYVSEYKTNGSPGNQPITPTISGASVTAITASAVSNLNSSSSTDANSGPYSNAADGLGTIWAAGFNDHDLAQFLPGSSSTNKVNPCLGAATTCPTIFTGATNKPTSVSIDSTGSVWATNPGGPQVVQVIGSAAPTWPLLSLGKVGRP